MQKLPKSDYRWLSEIETSKFDIDSIDLDGDLGFIVQCDLIYPKKIHNNLHNCLTLAPECLEISDSNLSPYAKKALIDSGCKEKYRDSKLVATFYDRKDYVLHFKNLKLYKDLGMKISKIHRILEFKQEAFIAPYIEMCTLARKNSTKKFDINQFKKLVIIIFKILSLILPTKLKLFVKKYRKIYKKLQKNLYFLGKRKF